ncbi:MAG: hypothetical protein A3I78_00905 [Gammaproteobacteria bacterium RIFCSPLOWO2_02_FULL_56_15]|nr:MAG: hypothetical protein A3I78_00905 [Gammaproteobacteria bacterium RIFCSPLOWO2_02_FULL_56_15]
MQEHRVLIIEHDDRVCRVLGRIITRMGYAALAAADYDSFKAFYNEQVPAVILLNLEIAGNDNAEFCRYLVERKSPTAIILLSDREEDKTTDLMQLGLSAGLNMCGVLHKPVDVEAVKELLAGRVPPQPSSPLKKSHEHGRIRRTKNRKQGITFDPDQQIEWQSCFIIDTKHNMYNRTTDLIPISILQGIIP